MNNHFEIITGIVEKYAGNGRKLGYPTANLSVATKLNDGVYFGFAKMANFINHPALIFIGTPTTMGDKDRRVEAYLLDIPDSDYYGEKLKLDIVYFHRSNQTFSSVESLKSAMKTDETFGRQWFADYKQKTQ